MPRSGKLPVLFLLTGQKSGFSPRRGDSLHRFRSNYAIPTGTWVRLAGQNFTSIGADGWECGPQNIKNFHFLVKSRPVGATPLTNFQNFQGLYTSNYPTLVFRISYDSHHRLRSYCGETARLLIRSNFSVHPIGKTIRWIEKWMPPFMMGTTSSITMQSLGKIVQRAPAVGAKMWCLFCLFVCLFVCFLSRSESGAPCVRRVHSSNTHCVAIYRPISTRFAAFFGNGLHFQTHIRR